MDRITSADVLGCLAPIWTSKPAAARKARNRIAAVFRWCIGRNHRADNPVDRAVVALPRANGNAPNHYRALPHREVAAALGAIRRVKYIHPSAVLCVEMIALTAVRAGEARGARWDEIDLEAGVWTIPASRMKAGREFSAPLSTGAVSRVVVGVSLEDRRAVARERAGARASASRGRLDGSRVPFERAVVDGGVRRPCGGRGGLPRPRPAQQGRSGVSAVPFPFPWDPTEHTSNSVLEIRSFLATDASQAPELRGVQALEKLSSDLSSIRADLKSVATVVQRTRDRASD